MADLRRRRLLGLAAAAATAAGTGAVAACAPALVQVGAVGRPYGTTASPIPSRTTSAPAPAPTTTSPSATPSPPPTLPPLSRDSIVLNGSALSFQSPAGVPGWTKTLGVGSNAINRTFYDDASRHFRVIVEVDSPTGTTALGHAQQLASQFQTGQAGYHQLALQSGPDGGATWAWSYPSGGATLYAIDWFQSYEAFDAALEVTGPIADRDFIKALWRAMVDSAYTSAPYQTPSGGLVAPFTSPSATTPSASAGPSAAPSKSAATTPTTPAG